MPTVVVPFRAAGKSRLPPELRSELARAMLADVVAAALDVGRVLVVTDDPGAVPRRADVVDDPGGGQGAAVMAAIGPVDGPVLVVNADVPCVTADALSRLAAAAPALVPAADGTTNALALPDPSWFAPVYGPGSAVRFAERGLAPVEIPELSADVDTIHDLERLTLPVGPATSLVAGRQGRAVRAGR